MTEGEVWEDFDELHELAMVGDVGSAQTLAEYTTPAGRPRKRKRRMKRPMGFFTDIDKLEPADD